MTTIEERIPEPVNPLGMDGIEFVEYATSQPQAFGALLQNMGFAALARHRSREVMLYRQGTMNLIVSRPSRCACATRARPSSTRSTWAPGRCRRAPPRWSCTSPASTA
jgi:4-hydroxyphenylpyruvate dioxygenase